MATVNILVSARNQANSAFNSVQNAFRFTGAAGQRSAQQIRDGYQQANRTVDRLSTQLTQARRNQARLTQEAGRTALEVRRLEQAVNAATSAADRNRLQRQLDAARRAAQRAADAVRNADANVGDLSRSLNRAEHNARQLAHQMNRVDRASNSLVGQFRNAFSRGIRQAVTDAWEGLPPQVRGAIVVAGVAMAAMLATAVGAVLNAGILAAIGGGGLAAGIALAIKDQRIEDAFKPVLDEIVGDAKSAAHEFVEPLVESAGIFRKAWAGAVSGDVRTMFADLATTVKPLASGLSLLVQNAMPGLKKAVAAAVPILQEFARMLPGIGRGLNEFFGSIAAGKDGAIKGLRLAVMLAIGTLVTFGNLIEYLSKRFDTLTEGAERLTDVLSRIPGVGLATAFVMAQLNEFFENLNHSSEGSSRNLGEVAESSDDAAKSMRGLAKGVDEAAKSMSDLADKIANAISQQLGVDQATIAWHQSLTALRDAFKENGRELDLNTAKGQANRQAILGVVQAAEAQRQANIANNMSVGEANAKYDAQIGTLKSVLRQMGLTEAQINSLIGAYGRIPREIWTTIYVRQEYRGITNPQTAMDLRLGRRAHGGVSGGWTMVGERGRELVKLPQGSMVYPHGQSEQMAAKGGGAQRLFLEVRPAPSMNRELADAIVRNLSFQVRGIDGGIDTLLAGVG